MTKCRLYTKQKNEWGGFYTPEMDFLTKEAMEDLPTHRLLSYYKKLRSCGDYTREIPEWEDTMKDAKSILDTREHMEKK